MTTITRSIEINASRDTIPQYYHPVHTPQWSPRLTLWEPEDGWPAAGTTARMGVKSGGISAEGIATTIAYDEATMAHHFRFVPSNLAPTDFWVTSEEQDGKTTVAYKVEYTIPGSFLGQALDKLFVERQNAKDIEQQLVNLKALAEGSK